MSKREIETLHNVFRNSEFILDHFHLLYYGASILGGTWSDTLWLGVPTQKCPLDLWLYQEIIHETRPDVIIESGTFLGGSALFLASMCDLVGRGKVITIDVTDMKGKPQHERIEYLVGSSTSPEIVNKVKNLVLGQDKVVVILDSDHHKEHVLSEMRIYGQFVTEDGFLIVEDTNVNGHPVLPDFGPGPMEAVQEFLDENKNFLVDEGKGKFLLTFSPRGYLRKVAG